jgi:beta-1,2-mannobiose phosphorylase / 1,2-beta-oligomannan phosphorylase
MIDYPLPLSFSISIFVSVWALLFLLILFLISRNKGIPFFRLIRHDKNPLIEPDRYSDWEDQAIFNPAAILDDEGIVHLLYRAIGRGGLSQIGYARSKDGTNFDSRSPYPVHQPERDAGLDEERDKKDPKEYNPSYYTSGGGWGGSEDPRAVLIEDRVYVNYLSFGGWHSMRIALTSILLNDLKKNQWKWKKPRLISPKGETHKNWMLFPEKINGKYALLTGITPSILITYLDNLENFQGIVKSERPQGPQPGRETHWDNLIRGAGAPPIKTDLGWLLLYHAIDKKEPHRYKVGAMLLSLEDPTKIIYRSPHPILSPDMHYENDGKPGIVYVSGAVVKDGQLHIYYGGGDKCICSAHTPMRELLDWLRNYGRIKTA